MDKQSEHVVDCLIKASTATQKLVDLGVTIISIIIANSKPTIIVQSHMALKQLGGGVHIIRPDRKTGGRCEICATEYAGCEIKWSI